MRCLESESKSEIREKVWFPGINTSISTTGGKDEKRRHKTKNTETFFKIKIHRKENFHSIIKLLHEKLTVISQ